MAAHTWNTEDSIGTAEIQEFGGMCKRSDRMADGKACTIRLVRD